MTVIDPRITGEIIEPPCADIELLIPEDLYYLEGHFPGRPILPGVVQVHWAISLARRGLSLQPNFIGIEALKFHRIIEPSTPLRLALEQSDDACKLRFSYTSDLGTHSKGRILFG